MRWAAGLRNASDDRVRKLNILIRPHPSRVADWDGVDWQRFGLRTAPPLPLAPALAELLPGGLRRGSTVSVSGSVSLLRQASITWPTTMLWSPCS